LAHHGVYRQNLVQTLAGQGISELAALGAGHIGQSYQTQDLDFASHKLVHGALAMASTMAYGALSHDIDWTRALVAAGAVMGAETVAEEFLSCVAGKLPKPSAQESEEAYIQRFEADTRALAQNTAACLRVLTAAGFTLAGKDASTITAADSAAFNGLENNFVPFAIASGLALLAGLEVYDGAEDVQDALEQGENAQAALIAAKTAVKVMPGMKIGKSMLYASETWQAGKAAYAAEGLVGVGKTAAEIALGKRLSRVVGKGLQKLQGRVTLRRAPKALTGTTKMRASNKALGDGGKHISTVEEKVAVEKYFTEYRKEKFVVDTYGGKDIKEAQGIRHSVEPGRTAKHHVGTHKNNKIFIDPKIKGKDGVSILIPKEWHKDFVHGANKVEHENFRQALFTSIKDMRKLPDRMNAGALREEVRKDLNEALLEALKKNKEIFPEHLKK
jgi:hypothetical protein